MPSFALPRLTSQMTLFSARPTRAAAAVAFCLSMGLCAGSVVPASAASSRRAPARIQTSKAHKPIVRKSTASHAYSADMARARRARLAKARVAARMRIVRDTPIPRFKTDETGSLVPDLHAAAAIIYNPDTHQVLWEENSQDKRSIASITKVMTAVVFVESEPDMSEVVTVDRSDTYAASTTHLRANYRVSVHDLLHLMLISSDNAAARALARISAWGPAGFVSRMNEKATELGLQSTSYADPSGLDAANVSSAYDMARLIAYASSDDRISEIMRKAEYTLPLGKRPVTIHSTNRLLTRSDLESNVVGAKTGFIGQSGYCLATLLKLPSVNQQVAVVVLGARSNSARFNEVRNLFSWLSGRAHDLVGKKDDQQN
jgi:serine-type D-Ala-D-Ala endopeptidase (penicillin-binding protein 7)